jgi:hypothetical protein
MRFNTKILLVLSALTVLFNSCKNDLKILAPYKESVSVYAILNANDRTNYIRINKIYLGEGNAYTMATVQDSVNYQKGVLDVTLERTYYGNPAPPSKSNSSLTKIILRDTVFQLEPGAFHQTQRLWYTNERLWPEGEYKLTIKNNKTGNVFTASTTMVDSLIPTLTQPLRSPYYPVAYSPSNPPSYYQDLSAESLKRKIEFVSRPGVREYQLYARFHYIDSTATGNIPRYVDFPLPSATTQNLSGGEILEVNWYSGELFTFIYSKLIDATPNTLFRRAIKIDYVVTGGNQVFVDFLKVNAPSTSVAQDKPAYTNIDGGFGIFGSRCTFIAPKEFHTNTLDHLATTYPYCNLRFVKSDGTPAAVCF